jgi:hypothetical protein
MSDTTDHRTFPEVTTSDLSRAPRRVLDRVGFGGPVRVGVGLAKGKPGIEGGMWVRGWLSGARAGGRAGPELGFHFDGD